MPAIGTDQRMCSEYLIGRLPLTTDARTLHSLFRPPGSGGGRRTYNYDSGASVAPSVSASTTNSILGLSRMRKVSSTVYLDESELNESELLLGLTNHTLDESSIDVGHVIPSDDEDDWNSPDSDDDGREA